MTAPSYLLKSAVILAAANALSISAAIAGEITTRVVDCAAGSCVQVTGHRADATAAISINGHPVAAEGAHKWRVRLPVETLRQWSAPMARSITVSVADGAARSDSEARLPIGLLGHAEDLAFLVISMK